MMSYDGHFFSGGGFMWIFWILLFMVIIFLAKTLTMGNSKTSGNSKSSDNEEDSPLDILKNRYARGEINDEEYEHKRKELEKD